MIICDILFYNKVLICDIRYFSGLSCVALGIVLQTHAIARTYRRAKLAILNWVYATGLLNTPENLGLVSPAKAWVAPSRSHSSLFRDIGPALRNKPAQVAANMGATISEYDGSASELLCTEPNSIISHPG